MDKFMGIILAAGKGTRMNSELPKVLHKVNDIPMVTRCFNSLKEAGAEKIVVVVGYKKELIEEELGDAVSYVTQDKQLGTGHAVQCAKDEISDYDGKVVIIYGDNPLLSSHTIKNMVISCADGEAAGSLLTITLENPPAAGRIIRDSEGLFQEIIEEPDCTDEQKKIKEINCGTYCIDGQDLIKALAELKSDNKQNEYYLTDVLGILKEGGKRINVVVSDDIFEIIGVNTQMHREFAESRDHIEYAESLYDLIDATIEMNKTKPKDG